MSVNISQAMNSPSYAHKLWLNYYYGDNSMDISASVIGRIEAAWGEDSGYNYIAQWERTAAMDRNEYEIPDEDFSNFKEQGKEAAKDSTGYENSTGDKVGQWGRAAGDAVVGGAEGAYGLYHAGKGAVSMGKSILGKGAETAAEEASRTAAREVAEDLGQEAAERSEQLFGTADGVGEQAAESGAEKAAGGQDYFLVAACALNLATGIAAVAKTANEEQVTALENLANGAMGEQMALTQEKQSEMESMSQELMEATDEAAEVNEDANTKIDDEKTKYDMYKTTYEYLAAKNEAARTGGEPLTDDEKALFAEVSKYMTETGANITKTQDEASAKVSDIHSDMETYQEGFDSAAETIATTDGVTEYAAGFDKATKTACYVEAAAQGLNAAGGVVNAIRAGIRAAENWFPALWGFCVMYIAAAASAAAGAVMSGIAVFKQMVQAQTVDQEIALRENTENLNTATKETYDTEVENFAQNVGAVENLELTVPDDTEAPESIEFAEAQPEQEENPRRNEENA